MSFFLGSAARRGGSAFRYFNARDGRAVPTKVFACGENVCTAHQRPDFLPMLAGRSSTWLMKAIHIAAQNHQAVSPAGSCIRRWVRTAQIGIVLLWPARNHSSRQRIAYQAKPHNVHTQILQRPFEGRRGLPITHLPDIGLGRGKQLLSRGAAAADCSYHGIFILYWHNVLRRGRYEPAAGYTGGAASGR